MTDAYERSLYAQLCSLIPALAALDEEFGEVVGDMALLLWQAAPRVTDLGDAQGSEAQRVVTAMLASVQVQHLRRATMHDAYASAYGTVCLRPVLVDLRADATRPVRITTTAAQAALEGLAARAGLLMALGTSPSSLRSRSVADQVSLSQRLLDPAVQDLLARMNQLSQLDSVLPERPEIPSGVELSARTDDLLPAELAALSGPTRLEVLQRLAEGRARTIARESASRPPLVICVDSSASMQVAHDGVSNEAWAKALACALANRALTEGRQAVVILFASQMDHVTFKMTTREEFIDQVPALLATHLGGGTDFASALALGAGHFPTTCREEAAIVFVSDAEGRLSASELRMHRQRQLRVVAVTMGNRPILFADTCLDLEDFREKPQNGRFPGASQDLSAVGYRRGKAAS